MLERPLTTEAIAPARKGLGATLAPHGRQWWVLVAYGLLFHLAHTLAAWWGGAGFFSLWYPPAGLRFALLWILGPQLTIAAALIELIVQGFAGVLDFNDPDWATRAVSIVRPPLAYGVAIALVRRLTLRPSSTLSTPPMPFGLAAVLAPAAAVLAALPWSLARPDFTGVASGRDIVASLSTFLVGDLLGVLLLSPPLIFAANALGKRKRARPSLPTFGQLCEYVAVFGTCATISWALAWLDIAETLMPVLLASCWIGLRFGRTAAWITIVIVALVVFPLTSGMSNVQSKLGIHMSMAAVAIAGYLAASFSTAMRRAQEEIARRDRLLLHAERLKSLRSMSVALIHEASQPLSTLVLETRYLRKRVEEAADRDLIEAASLVERKTDALATMVTRLREFGSRGERDTVAVDITACVNEALELLDLDFREVRKKVRVESSPTSLMVRAARIELIQCFVNLLRNSLQAGGEGAIIPVRFVDEGNRIMVLITNPVRGERESDGMGIGLIISKTILEAFGGTLAHHGTERSHMLTVVTLPKEAA